MDHIDHVGQVYPGRKKYTRGGDQEHCFNVSRCNGRFVDIMRYESLERATRERAAFIELHALAAAPDTDEMERTLDDLMRDHIAAKIVKQDDGSWLVTADGKYEYVIFTDGTRTSARELV